MGRTAAFQMARLAVIVLLALPVYGVDCCTQPSNPCLNAVGSACAIRNKIAGTPCSYEGIDGWCQAGECVEAGNCPAGSCDDGNDCTDDVCNPGNGFCTNTAAIPGFSDCKDNNNNSGICVENVCVDKQVDHCLRRDAGRINCCADADCDTNDDYTTICPSPMTNDEACDPTGIEAPGASPNQVGKCNAQGVCVYKAGPCKDTVCPGADLECVKAWCDPETGDCHEPVYVAGKCRPPGGPNGFTCAYGVCTSTNGCSAISQAQETQCCEFKSCPCPGCCYTDARKGWYCDPNGTAMEETDTMGYGGRCSVVPSGSDFETKCVPTACAVEDPVGSGQWTELDCDDGNPCTTSACDPDTGACAKTRAPDQTFCNGGTGMCFLGYCRTIPDACAVGAPGYPCYPCTEQGILDAVADGGGPHSFLCLGPTTVTMTGTLVVDNDVILDGGGLLTIEGFDGTRLMEVNAGVVASLRRMTFQRGPNANPVPGGIFNDGTLTLTHVVVGNCHTEVSPVQNTGTLTLIASTVAGNSSVYGTGGIRNSSGATLDLIDSYLFANETTGFVSGPLNKGGALRNSGVATVSGGAISGNSARDGGGGIFNTGSLTITNATISNNSATAANGGGILNSGTGPLTIVDTVIEGNTATGDGGGIRNDVGATLVMTGSTVSDNGAGLGGGIGTEGGNVSLGTTEVHGNNSIAGGGIYAGAVSTLSVVDSTVSENTSVTGGGIFIDSSSATLVNSTVADNFGGRRRRWDLTLRSSRYICTAAPFQGTQRSMATASRAPMGAPHSPF